MIDRGFLFNPDYEVRSQIRMIGGMPDLFQFDHVFISCSGGKDSQAMSYLIAELAEKQGYPKENIELLYADTGFEWHDTFEHVKKIGEYLGIKAVKVLPKFKLLDNVRRRWIKFNGLEEQNRTEQNRTEQNRTMETSQAERRKQCKSISEPNSKILYKRPQANSDRAVCPFPSQNTMWCRSHGKQFPIEQYIRNYKGGAIKAKDLSQVNTLNFARHWENKIQCFGMSETLAKNPFPVVHAKFCTGEGKVNPIKDRIRNKNKEDG